MSAEGDRLYCNPNAGYLVGYIQSGLEESGSGLPDPVAAGCVGTWECDILLGKWQYSASLLELSCECEARANPAFSIFVHPSDRSAFLDALHQSRRSNSIREIAHHLPDQGGAARLASTFVLATRENGKTVRLTGAVFDAELRRRHMEGARSKAIEEHELEETVLEAAPNLTYELQLEEMVRQLRLAEVQLRERQEELEELNQRLAALATTDGLTGVYNYRAFHEKLAEEMRRARRYDYPVSIVMADIDDFKAYNDEFGHPAGDALLKYFAGVLDSDSRDTDFVARLGGEEFGLILLNTGAHDAVRFAQRIIDHMHLDEASGGLTASFGCVELEAVDKTKEDFIRRADDCLYKAKRQGKNRVVAVVSNQTAVTAL